MKEFLLSLFRTHPAPTPPPPTAPSPNPPKGPEFVSLQDRARALRPVDVGRGRFDQPIVGEASYQELLQRLKQDAFVTSNDRPILPLLLIREPENRYDRNAIAVTTETADVVGYLSRADAVALQTVLQEHEQRGEVMRCIGTLVGDQQVGVWLNLPHLTERQNQQVTTETVVAEYANLDVCRETSNVADLISEHRPYSRSRPNWAGSRVAAIGAERYLSNLERVSRGRCENGERIRLKVHLIPDRHNPVDSDAVVVATSHGDVLGYLSKGHVSRWGSGIRAFFDAGRVICRNAGLHQRTFKSGKRQFYLAVEMTDAEWLEEAANRLRFD